MFDNYRRLAIIDHDTHTVIIDDISVQKLDEQYNGEEQDYIDAEYNLTNYSWDWVIDAQYIGKTGFTYDLDSHIDDLEPDCPDYYVEEVS